MAPELISETPDGMVRRGCIGRAAVRAHKAIQGFAYEKFTVKILGMNIVGCTKSKGGIALRPQNKVAGSGNEIRGVSK